MVRASKTDFESSVVSREALLTILFGEGVLQALWSLGHMQYRCESRTRTRSSCVGRSWPHPGAAGPSHRNASAGIDYTHRFYCAVGGDTPHRTCKIENGASFGAELAKRNSCAGAGVVWQVCLRVGESRNAHRRASQCATRRWRCFLARHPRQNPCSAPV